MKKPTFKKITRREKQEAERGLISELKEAIATTNTAISTKIKNLEAAQRNKRLESAAKAAAAAAAKAEAEAKAVQKATEIAKQRAEEAAQREAIAKEKRDAAIKRDAELIASLNTLMAHSVGAWCDDYLRQLATKSAQVHNLAQMVAIQQQLLKSK